MKRIERMEITARIVRWTEHDQPIWQPTIVEEYDDGSLKAISPSIYARDHRSAIEQAVQWTIELQTTID